MFAILLDDCGVDAVLTIGKATPYDHSDVDGYGFGVHDAAGGIGCFW